MAREIVWTEPAWDDLEAAAEYIRELLVSTYRLVYKLTNEHVFIVAFIHGARRLHRL
jgi:plasmid stabilization system protein ParE